MRRWLDRFKPGMILFSHLAKRVALQAKALIFHAIRLILRDPKTALRITLLPYLLAQLLPALLHSAAAPSAPTGLSSRLAADLALLAGMAWRAVAWHRFILIQETGLPLPPTSPGRVAAYLAYVAAFEAAVILASFSAIEGLAAMDIVSAAGWAFQVPIYLGLLPHTCCSDGLEQSCPPSRSALCPGSSTDCAPPVALPSPSPSPTPRCFFWKKWCFASGRPFQSTPAFRKCCKACRNGRLGIALLTSTYLQYVKGQPLD